MEPPTEREMATLIAQIKAEDYSYGVFTAFLAYTGCRLAGALNARWSDWVVRQIRKGDLVIQIDERGNSRYALEAALFLSKRKRKSRRGASVTYPYLACRSTPRKKAWRVFRNYCISIGLKLPRGVEAREIRDWRKANKAVAFLAHQ